MKYDNIINSITPLSRRFLEQEGADANLTLPWAMRPFYSRILLAAYMVLGIIVYLAALRLLKAAQKHDIDLIHKYLGTRLGFVSKLLAAILIAKWLGSTTSGQRGSSAAHRPYLTAS
jgi:hypothetical protein